MIPPFDLIYLLCPDCGETHDQCNNCHALDRLKSEGRRYLYRNVACEARKTSALEKHVPDVRGWT